MNNTSHKFLSCVLAFTVLSGCQQMNKQGMGTAVGAVAGGLLGSTVGKGSGKLFAVGAGALAGALVGSAIGQNLDEIDRKLMEQSSQRALESAPSGQAVEWSNPDSGHKGYIEPTKTYKASNGNYCREYVQTVIIGGKEEKAYGVACRQPDGQWKIQETN